MKFWQWVRSIFGIDGPKPLYKCKYCRDTGFLPDGEICKNCDLHTYWTKKPGA